MSKGSGEGRVVNFDHLVFWVANANTAASYFVSRLGFRPLAVREPAPDRPVLSRAVRLNKITIIFESPTSPSPHPISEDLSAHGDFVKDVSFAVEALDALVAVAEAGGARVLKGVTEEADEDGVVRFAVLQTVSYVSSSRFLHDSHTVQVANTETIIPIIES
ncbi:hypothetical protein JYU34_006052 [Plutella xylostella]|uniref:4-hydroxyphenylpyruvate dioxygenase n=1 Tax=Plutella xylostella TaxID=51655 RepID=A0ABQ7QUV5_PLUXY|nr:hypothetical protein JYU34_006052 [Plutella xylostella]